MSLWRFALDRLGTWLIVEKTPDHPAGCVMLGDNDAPCSEKAREHRREFEALEVVAICDYLSLLGSSGDSLSAFRS